MADMYAVSGETLTGIADAIRSKTGSDEQLTVASMAAAIEGISGGVPGFSKVAGGTMRFDETTSFVMDIHHNLGQRAKAFFLFCEDYSQISYPATPNTLLSITFVDQLNDSPRYRVETADTRAVNGNANGVSEYGRTSYAGYVGSYPDYIALGKYGSVVLTFYPNTNYKWIALA